MQETVIKVVLKKDAKVIDCQNLIKELIGNKNSQRVEVLCEIPEGAYSYEMNLKH